jgi:hypothetical protein
MHPLQETHSAHDQLCYNTTILQMSAERVVSAYTAFSLDGMEGDAHMPTLDVDAFVVRLLPQILCDRDLGNGRTFTQLHLRRLWALLCLQAGEYVDEALLAHHVLQHLPPSVRMEKEVAATTV